MTTDNMRKLSLPNKDSLWLRVLTSTRAGAVVLVAALLVGYGVLPLGVAATFDVDSSYTTLAGITLVAVMALALGAATPLLDSWLDGRQPRVVIVTMTFNASLWSAFVIFVFVAWGTAPQIPLIAALGGADPNTVAVLREQFLKSREGWQSSFVYINAILSGALIPYSLALMFLHGIRWRWLAAGFFLVFCISFVEKAFFFKAAFPLIYLVAQGQAKTRLSPRMMMVGTIGLLLLVTLFAGSGSLDDVGGDPFFSVSYVPQGGIQHLIWRSVAIPIVTAADALRVLQEQFSGQPLMGATSSFVAGIFGMERIEFERMVFAAQWGQNETGTGSSNSVYLTEAFINFGWTGVVVFSFVVGQLMRMFAVSRDEAFRALWPLFVFGVYTSGLIGLLLSNGFVLLFAIALFTRIRPSSPCRRSITVLSSPSPT
jgi:small basic protein